MHVSSGKPVMLLSIQAWCQQRLKSELVNAKYKLHEERSNRSGSKIKIDTVIGMLKKIVLPNWRPAYLCEGKRGGGIHCSTANFFWDDIWYRHKTCWLQRRDFIGNLRETSEIRTWWTLYLIIIYLTTVNSSDSWLVKNELERSRRKRPCSNLSCCHGKSL